MTFIFKNMDTNRTTTNGTVALGWIKQGYRVIPIME